MRKSSGIIYLGILLLFACNKDNGLPEGFDMVYTRDFVIPAGIGVDAKHHFYLANIPTRYTQYLDQHNKQDVDIKRILPGRIILSALFTDGNFDYVGEAALRVYDEDDTNDFIEIAYRVPVPLSGNTTLELIPNEPDVKRFLSASRFNVDLVLTLRNVTQAETDARIDLQFRAAYE